MGSLSGSGLVRSRCGDDALLREFIFPGGPIYFPCLAGRNSLSAPLGNWLAKGLICFTVFGRYAEKIDEIRGAQGKTGNLSTRKRLVVGLQPA
jgi:hypothetical protein